MNSLGIYIKTTIVLLGISSYSFPWATGIHASGALKKLSALGLMDIAAENKIKYVQYGDNMPLHLLSNEELKELKKVAGQSGIQLQAGTKGLTVENLEQYLIIAQTISSPFIRMVIDADEYEPEEAEVIHVIKKLLPSLKKYKVILAIENHDRFSSAVLKRIILRTDPDFVGICLDTVNSLGAGEGINEVLHTLAPFTINLHIKDFIIKRVSNKMGFIVEGTPAGEGMLDIRGIIKQVDKTGKCNTATLEVWSNPENTIDLTLLKEKQWVEKSIQYLKKILA